MSDPQTEITRIDESREQEEHSLQLEYSEYSLIAPSVLTEFDKAVPGSASMLMEAMLNEGKVRHKLELRGQLFGGILPYFGCACATGILFITDNFYQMFGAAVLALACVGGPLVANKIVDKLPSKPPEKSGGE